jgi:hypothetical protein
MAPIISRTGASQDFDGGDGAWEPVFGACSHLRGALVFHRSNQIHCYEDNYAYLPLSGLPRGYSVGDRRRDTIEGGVHR